MDHQFLTEQITVRTKTGTSARLGELAEYTGRSPAELVRLGIRLVDMRVTLSYLDSDDGLAELGGQTRLVDVRAERESDLAELDRALTPRRRLMVGGTPA